MTQSAYERAIDVFQALLNAPGHEAHGSPAGLIRAAGLPASSGYRHTATLEAEGMLRRDAQGCYLPGMSAIRIGLQGFGVGRLAPLVQPILLQLRQSSQMTSFLAMAQDLELHMGPHSVGRETRATPLQRSYGFETIPEFNIGQVTETSLRWFEGRVARRTNVALIPVESTASSIAVVGLVLNSTRGATDLQNRALRQAYGQIAKKEV
ncbi:helix-turn-helix domain-containing protein [Ruegeria sp. HKCCD4884]|uniref:helix-turn-helix domain-containing protein n=1 Tax=Ruegeria sp. HKCCD4884 TaxID=2683022 RepID=UPI00149211E8|nr:helix-turn-helix domain-containing protein [Ruegeria sp. HKCCD4884]NOD92381.1 helix-turn-helix domain-containing protein [Ruegeria sp. HKCCD4884]